MLGKHNDHIALPRSALLTFSESGLFRYLDFADNKIHKGSASNYNTEIDYYSQIVESNLHDFETHMGRVRKALMEFHATKSEFIYPDGLKDDVIAWIAIQTIRHKDFAKKVKQGSIIPEIMNSSDDERNFSPLHLGNTKVQKAIGLYRRGLSSHRINIAIIDQSCTLTWCLTPNYYVCHNNAFFFPLSPHEALALLPDSSPPLPEIWTAEGDIVQAFIRFKKDEEIQPLLHTYISSAKKHSLQHLIGLKPCLERIQQLSIDS